VGERGRANREKRGSWDLTTDEEEEEDGRRR